MVGLASQYDFSLIASSGETYSALGAEVALNDGGAVGFKAALPEGGRKLLLG